jgi:uronate dehydrogenase
MGRATVAALNQAGWRVRGFDLTSTPGAQVESIEGTLTDLAALTNAAEDVRAVIHLAATPDDDDFTSQLLPNNLLGVYNVVEAARRAGVKRLVLASSGQVNWWQQAEGPWPVRAEDPITPRHWYAAGKVFLEAAGCCYARDESAAVLAVRLGWCPRSPAQVAEISKSELGQNVYFSPGDVGRFFQRSVEAELAPGFHVLFATSRPLTKTILDLGAAQRLLGWEPTEQWPMGVELTK